MILEVVIRTSFILQWDAAANPIVYVNRLALLVELLNAEGKRATVAIDPSMRGLARCTKAVLPRKLENIM